MSWISDVMSELERLEATHRKLRNFGLLTGWISLAVALWIYFHKHAQLPAIGIGAPALLLIAGGCLAPSLLEIIYRLWMGLAFAIGWIVSRFLLSAIFFLVFMPFGYFARLKGEDFLDLGSSTGKDSFWVRRSKDTKTDYEKMF